MKAYLIVSGYYSDYHVSAVCTDREFAERLIAHANIGREEDEYGTHYSIQECDLNPGEVDVRAGLNAFYVSMDRHGNSESGSSTTLPTEIGDIQVRQPYCYNFVSGSPPLKGDWNISGTIMAKDAAHAAKIMNEHRVRWLAENEIKEEIRP